MSASPSPSHTSAPLPSSAHSTAATPPKRSLRFWGALGATAVALAVGASLVFGGSEVTAAPPADIPRIKDRNIVFSESFRDRIQLETTEVRSAPLTPVVSAVGMVSFNPKYTARVGTRLRGLVRTVQAYEGDVVKRGQSLAEIDSPELGDAQAQVAMLDAQAKTAARDAARERALADQNLSTIREAEEAATEQNSYESMLRAAQQKVSALAGGSVRALGVHALTSPLDGTVVERHVTQGELVDGDHVAFLVSNLNHLWVELDVFERNLHTIRIDDEVVVRPLSGAGGDIKGRVAQVSAVIDPATRSATVRIEVDNSVGILRPGQAVDAKIHASNAAQETATLIPVEAITYVDGEPTVFVMVDDLSVKPTIVELGDSNGKERQVLKGLEVGQRVATHGVFELKSELFR